MNLLTPFLRAIRVWVGNTLVGQRKGIRFQAGTNVTITGTDDSVHDRVVLTISSTESGGSGDAYSAVSDGTNTVSASGNETLLLTSPNSTIQITAVADTPDRVEFVVGSHPHAAGDITSGRFTQARMPTSGVANRFLVVRTANADPTYDTLSASDLPSHTHTRSQITDFGHQATHQAGGSDELTGNLNAVARTTVRVNSGSDVGSRRRLNFIAGSNVTISASDDHANEEVDITISASGSGNGSGLESVLSGIPIAIVEGLTNDQRLVVPYALTATAATTLSTAADSIYWVPWVVVRAISVSRVAVNVTTAASGSSVTIGLYSSNPLNSYSPASRLETTNSLSTTTTGLKSETVSWSLSSGVYWFALLVTGGAPTLRAIALAACRALALPSLGTANTTMWRTSSTSLPINAPNSGYTAVSSAVPAIGVNYTTTI